MYSSVGLRAPKSAVFAASVMISVATIFCGAAQRLGAPRAVEQVNRGLALKNPKQAMDEGCSFPAWTHCSRHGGVVLLPRKEFMYISVS